MGKPLRKIDESENNIEESPQHISFKEHINSCPHCKSKLLFHYESDYLSNSVIEVAECPDCLQKIHSGFFQVQ